MSTKKVSIEEMADAINEGLQEYADLAAEDMKAAVKKTATVVRKEISVNAPVDTGAHAKSWTARKTSEDSQSLQMTVYG
ncbi:MAG: HK97 gp10 family phage protein [Lachnospiraceae bacterium]|nr:HK97 gp10 family phage protein [Lachnospiraceae bacterium]